MAIDIASIYVVEDDKLVMRGNHGFPESAIGNTALASAKASPASSPSCARCPPPTPQPSVPTKKCPALTRSRFPCSPASR